MQVGCKWEVGGSSPWQRNPGNLDAPRSRVESWLEMGVAKFRFLQGRPPEDGWMDVFWDHSSQFGQVWFASRPVPLSPPPVQFHHSRSCLR